MDTLNFAVSVKTGQGQVVLTDFVEYLGWTATIPDPEQEGGTIANPVTKPQYAKQMIASYIRNCVEAQRVKQVEVTRQAKIDEVTNLSIK